MSLSVLEAMARGLSVVATDVAGSREQIGEEAGAVVPPEDAAGLAREVAARLADPSLRATEGRAARERAVLQHDVRRTTAEVAELYAELVGEATTNARVPAA
jgi:glycosyltransferase involved in cell wall biosynthesis